MHKILQLFFILTQWEWVLGHLKNETMMHSKLSKMTLSKNLGSYDRKCTLHRFFVRFRPQNGADISNFAFFSSPMWPESIHLAPLPPKLHENGAILSCACESCTVRHLFPNFRPLYLHRNAPPHTDFEFAHPAKEILTLSLKCNFMSFVAFLWLLLRRRVPRKKLFVHQKEWKSNFLCFSLRTTKLRKFDKPASHHIFLDKFDIFSQSFFPKQIASPS